MNTYVIVYQQGACPECGQEETDFDNIKVIQCEEYEDAVKYAEENMNSDETYCIIETGIITLHRETECPDDQDI